MYLNNIKIITDESKGRQTLCWTIGETDEAMQFIDLETQYKRIKDKVDKSVLNALSAGKYIMGPDVTQLEQRLAAYVGRKHCISCSNGTDALLMPLKAYGIGAGDAVFAPAFTFFATAEVIVAAGAVPVFVDVYEDTFNLDAQKLEAAIMKVISEGRLRPKMIIPVDLFGQTADYNKILKIAKQYNLLVMEDGAQGFGGTLQGNKACSFGDVSTTSFFPAKPLGCYGDGGAIFTDDDDLAALLCSIRVHGHGSDKYDNVRIGLNARLDTVQAAVLNCKLDIFDDELVARNKAAAMYTAALHDMVDTPRVPENMVSSWAQYTIKLDSEKKRTEVMEKMKSFGVPTMIYYSKPMHLQTAFQYLGGKEGDFPVSEDLCRRVLSIPMHPYLDDATILKVTDALKNSIA